MAPVTDDSIVLALQGLHDGGIDMVLRQPESRDGDVGRGSVAWQGKPESLTCGVGPAIVAVGVYHPLG